VTDTQWTPDLNLLSALPGFLTIIAPDGTVLWANRVPQDMPHKELIGRSFSRLVEPDAVQRVRAAFLQAIESGQPTSVEIRGFSSADGRVWYLTDVVPLAPEHPSHLMVTMCDLTDRRRADLQLQAAQKQLAEKAVELQHANEQLSQLAEMVAHDLRPSVRGVTSFAQLLSEQLAGRLTDRELLWLRQIHNGAGGMRRLINALLKYSSETSKQPIAAEIDLDAQVDGALMRLSPQIVGSGTEIIHQPLGVAMADGAHIQRVFQHLIENAIRYRDRARSCVIRIQAHCDEHTVTISVSDNGPGLRADARRRVFDIFWRGDATEQPGDGLGLAICRRLVQWNGGRISVDATPGVGSTFTFSLPA